ncbi:serine protease SP24D-like [Uranotaenia lowii]|uniref:serine protease SP24D-like n=1 Tax=Uranotaenia lowii TaxID=190385 RepID=UPI00247B1017|nr:serine protease SP24D-like [Uranotaenia lowii]
MNTFTTMLLALVVVLATIGYANAVALRIPGGQYAEKGQFPYQVAIRKPEGVLLCGGVLITGKFVLTQASCFFDGTNLVDFDRLQVFYSATELSDAINGWFRHPRSLRLHDNFDIASGQGKYDFAIVELHKSVEISDLVNVVPVSKTPFTGNAPITVTGWGNTGNGPENTNNWKLKYGNLNALSEEECKAALGDGYFPGVFCAKSDDAAICSGDFGGPAVSNNLLIGISNGIVGKSCEVGATGVFIDQRPLAPTVLAPRRYAITSTALLIPERIFRDNDVATQQQLQRNHS